MKRLGFLISATVALVFVVSSSAKADPIVLLEDNFDSATPGSNVDNFSNWNVFDGSVDVIGTGTQGSFVDLLPGNGYYVDLDGSTGDAARLESKSLFSFEIGDIINLSFDLAGSQRTQVDDVVTVSLGSIFSEEFELAQNDPFTTFNQTIDTSVFNINSLTDLALAFDHQGGDAQGLLLDNVLLSVDRETESVPEPGTTAALLVLGGLGIKSLRQRKQNQ